MLEKIENRLNKEGRKQRGKKKLKCRVNITFPIKTIGVYAKRDVEIKLEQLKQIRHDLIKILEGLYKITFTVLPNKSFTKKGILVRMGKGKGKIDHFSSIVPSGTICIILVPKTSEKKINFNKFLIKYPFFGIKNF